jgi:hypothetical protein
MNGMIERIVENWLTKANEKSFQIPFCQMLAGEGYVVVHLTRHGSFEEGKDILAIAPDGTPCAFQLKGSDTGKITQKEWAKYIDQVTRLVEIPIKHPSIDEAKERKVFFVTNGELDEEVRVEIAGRNSDWQRRKHPVLTPIVKGEILTGLMKIHTDLWPEQLTSEKELLELFLANGKGYLDKEKLAHFLENMIISPAAATKAESPRNLASAAIFTSYALSPFTQSDNYVAVIEGWTIFLACLIAFVEKSKLEKKYWCDSANIAEEAIKIALLDLVGELMSRTNYLAGNPLVDSPFYKGRITWLMGYASVFALWEKMDHPDKETDQGVLNFLISNYASMSLWGEAAVPQILAVVWAFRMIGLEYKSDQILFDLLVSVIVSSETPTGLADPYHGLGEVTLQQIGLTDKQNAENFRGRSYSLDSLIQLLARRNYRGVLADLWKMITGIHFAEFEPESAWQFCLWNCENGLLSTTMPLTPQSWGELVTKANSISLGKVPTYLVQKPMLLMLFLLVYPHRLTPDNVKYLDDVLKTSSNHSENGPTGVLE